MAPAVATYAPRDPSGTVLYHVIAEHLETFLASLADDPEATGLPAYVQREFHDYLRGFVKLLRLRGSSGKRVPLPSPIRPLGGPLRTCHFGPTRESLPHLLTIVGR